MKHKLSAFYKMWSLTRSLRFSTFAKHLVFPNTQAPCGDQALQPLQLLRVPTMRRQLTLLIEHNLKSLGAASFQLQENFCASFHVLIMLPKDARYFLFKLLQ